MAHDLTAYLNNKEIGHLSRAGFNNPEAIEIYIALMSSEKYRGVSGDGTSRQFTYKQIEAAIDYICSHNRYLPLESLFLADIFSAMKPEDVITINFW